MLRKLSCSSSLLACLILLSTSSVDARNLTGGRPSHDQPNATSPAYCNTYHNVGRIALEVSNDGTFANTGLNVSGLTRDCFTNETLPTCEFPKNSRITYCFGAALWVGAIVGARQDTLVSTGADGWAIAANEFHPAESPFGDMIFRSTIDPARPEYEGAVSEQDYIAVYSDTCRNCPGVTADEIQNTAHVPLNIEVTQRTFAWSYSYAQDFVLFDYAIRNKSQNRMHDMYLGFYVDADIHDNALQDGSGAGDDFCGFRKKQPALYMPSYCPVDSDEVNIAWTADNDAEFGQIINQLTPHITAMRIVRTPSEDLEVSFNWWVSNQDASLDWGPTHRANFRDFSHGGSGTPSGDRNKFHVMRNGEFDFDQPTCAVQGNLDDDFLPVPEDRAARWATGMDTRYLLSFGPFSVEPGQTLPVSLAYVAGMNFHISENNFANLPSNPDSWYAGVNFDSLGANATWADWVYDNPGYDTDSDGYFGEFTECPVDSTFDHWDTTWSQDTSLCGRPDSCPVLRGVYEYDEIDTVWRKGDGIPDFRGASPPPRPELHTVETGSGWIRLVWNGALSENTKDVFSREADFEGYRVWIARDERAASYSVTASYDIEDYNRWEYREATGTFGLLQSPFTLAELRCRYADGGCSDQSFLPENYPRHRPLDLGPDSIFYFEPQDFNRSVLGHEDGATTEIRKVWPDAPHPPVLEADSIRILYPEGGDTVYTDFITDDGFVKYYEYEYIVEDLLPTVPYWVNVTAFDYGSPKSGLAALETSPSILPRVVYPLPLPDPVDRLGNDKVFVWPNPYRLDGNYRSRGFEDFGANDIADDRVRAIHFANLPEECKISIYSLDGDMIREIDHPSTFYPDGGCPQTAHQACWDMITRNTQQVVSGLYYWTVEDNFGNIQIGKLAIIM